MQRKGFENRKEKFFYTLICTFVLGLIAHGYCYFNFHYSHDSLLTYQNDYSTQIANGRFLHLVWFMIRGNFYSPVLVGCMGLLFIGIAAYILSELLEINDKWMLILTSGVLVTNTTVTLVNASYMHEIDIYMLSLLFVVLGIYVCRRYRFGFFPAAVATFLSLGLYQSFFQVAVFFYMVLAVRDLLDRADFKKVMVDGGKAIGSLILGMVLYYGIFSIVLAITGVQKSSEYNGMGGVADFGGLSMILLRFHATYVYVRTYFMHPVTFHPTIVILIQSILLLVTMYMIFRIVLKQRLKWNCLILLIVILMLTPFGINVVYFITKGMVHNLMIYSFFCAYIFVLVILERYLKYVEQCRFTIKWSYIGIARKCVIPILVAVVIFNNIVYSNQAYLKKELENQSTLSSFTRIIDRMEQTEGYIVGETPVVFVGLMEYSKVSQRREGFDYSGTGLGCTFSVTYYETYQYYFDYVLGYPINMLSKDEAAEWSGRQDVIEMPKFPEKGCCQMIDGVMVVRLS